MARLKGTGKVPGSGRKRGSLNKKTVALEAFAECVINGGMEKFIEELEKLKGKAYVDSFLSVFEYVRPKLSRLGVEADGITIINIQPNENSNQLASLDGFTPAALCAPDGE